jgi:SWI/SNF-related matrix-associated actin-dependent regulator of chromatin subfamily A member 5
LGINLVSADTVIIYDIDWNPQNDIQAMDRAYRMGQTRTVHVYKLITEHTIEERMLEFQKYKLIWDELVIQKGGFVGKNKRKDDPFSNMNLNQLAMLGKGDIFKLEADESDQNIEVVLQLGEKKDREQDEEIRRKLMENIDRSNFNPFKEEEPLTCEEMEKYQSDLVVRRNYEQEKREKGKFDRMYITPPFKFYVKAHQIKELEFELYMEHKREDQNPKIIAKIN